ncbi:hypothetical protein CEXT_558721 [Caerostris extrusa]|uniref:Uncharacterized protein n=1 Tax=Caerostris extrusa TaxID=172846 RepID=A0AAV4W9R8_CAEEX|nr:hypothetical protein CEXT_558721 [Caerostris extrusa]
MEEVLATLPVPERMGVWIRENFRAILLKRCVRSINQCSVVLHNVLHPGKSGDTFISIILMSSPSVGRDLLVSLISLEFEL